MSGTGGYDSNNANSHHGYAAVAAAGITGGSGANNNNSSSNNNDNNNNAVAHVATNVQRPPLASQHSALPPQQYAMPQQPMMGGAAADVASAQFQLQQHVMGMHGGLGFPANQTGGASGGSLVPGAPSGLAAMQAQFQQIQHLQQLQSQQQALAASLAHLSHQQASLPGYGPGGFPGGSMWPGGGAGGAFAGALAMGGANPAGTLPVASGGRVGSHEPQQSADNGEAAEEYGLSAGLGGRKRTVMEREEIVTVDDEDGVDFHGSFLVAPRGHDDNDQPEAKRRRMMDQLTTGDAEVRKRVEKQLTRLQTLAGAVEPCCSHGCASKLLRHSALLDWLSDIASMSSHERKMTQNVAILTAPRGTRGNMRRCQLYPFGRMCTQVFCLVLGMSSATCRSRWKVLKETPKIVPPLSASGSPRPDSILGSEAGPILRNITLGKATLQPDGTFLVRAGVTKEALRGEFNETIKAMGKEDLTLTRGTFYRLWARNCGDISMAGQFGSRSASSGRSDPAPADDSPRLHFTRAAAAAAAAAATSPASASADAGAGEVEEFEQDGQRVTITVIASEKPQGMPTVPTAAMAKPAAAVTAAPAAPAAAAATANPDRLGGGPHPVAADGAHPPALLPAPMDAGAAHVVDPHDEPIVDIVTVEADRGDISGSNSD